MKYTKRSFHIAIFSSLLLLAFLLLSQTLRTSGNNLNDLIGYLLTLFMVSIVLGFIFALLSLKEAYHWKKYLGLGVNIFYFVLLLLALIGNLVDIARVL